MPITIADVTNIKNIVHDSVISVEKYVPKFGNNSWNHMCLYSYWFDMESDNITIKINVFLRKKKETQWNLRIAEVNIANNNGNMKFNFTDESTEIDKSYSDFTTTLETHLNLHLIDLDKYIKDKGKWWELFKGNLKENGEVYALNAVGDFSMFMLNNHLASLDSELENKIKDAGSRRAPNSKEIDKLIQNIHNNQLEEDKKKTNPAYTYTKLEPSTSNTLDIIKLVLDGIVIPKNNLTVQNIELDGAFRISFT